MASDSTFPVARYRLEWLVDTPLSLPEYAGSTLRGAWGHALRRTVCMTRKKECIPCPLYRSCPFPAIFAPPPPPDGHTLQDFNQIPVPFVIEPPHWGKIELQTGAILNFHIVLIGHAITQLPLVIHAWQRALRHGIGNGDGTASLQRVCLTDNEEESQDVYDIATGHIKPHATGILLGEPFTNTDGVTLNVKTPLRLQHNGIPIRPKDIHARDLLVHLMRRIALISEFHAGQKLEWNFHDLAIIASHVESEKSLIWRDWKRYSSRQKQEMKLGGVVGEWILRGELQAFLPMLRLGQWLHVGKNTSFGLGQYQISG